METGSIKIVISDGNYFVREGLKSLLQNEVGFSVEADVKNSEAALHLLKQGLIADVLLTELPPEEPEGAEFISEIKRQVPQLKVVVLGIDETAAYVSKALKWGADGYLLKSVGSHEVIFAIKQVINNSTYICSSLLNEVLYKFSQLNETAVANNMAIPNFTGREIEILTLISQGYTNAQISEMLFTSRRTIENYRQGLIDKTGSRNIVSLVRFALLNGLIS